MDSRLPAGNRIRVQRTRLVVDSLLSPPVVSPEFNNALSFFAAEIGGEIGSFALFFPLLSLSLSRARHGASTLKMHAYPWDVA